jgi:hypothetical protein
MQAFAISRTDPGAEGIEILWTWPDTLPLSLKGYDVLRLESREMPGHSICETIDAPLIDILRTKNEFTAPLGRLRRQTGAKFTSLAAAANTLSQAQAAIHALPGSPVVLPESINVPPATFSAMSTTAIPIECYIQELTQPADRVTISVNAGGSMAIAMAGGKAVASGESTAIPAFYNLTAPGIDTVMLYTVAVTSFTICEYLPPIATNFAATDPWSQATVIAKGLTLPIKEADPTLFTPAQEFAKAHSRIVSSETLDPNRFQRMADTLRAPTGANAMGRSGARISLNRSDATQSYEEIPLDLQLSALVLHPRGRRVLGFGHHDNNGLTLGAAYMYRVIGHFEAADLTDRIYDVHRVPTGTMLPDTFWISDLGFRCQTPVRVVLDPAPGANNLHAASRRGIRIDTTSFDDSWLLPSFGPWSALITLPMPVTKLTLEVAPGHTFTYAGGMPWSFSSVPVPLPAGPIVQLNFPTPIMELRLSGTGTFYALRLPSGQTGTVGVTADTGPILYAAEPLPAPPLVLFASNLQQPTPTVTGPIDEATPVPPRNPVGFKLEWLPAPAGGVTIWPQDIESGPPLDSLAYIIDHRDVTLPAIYGAWEPINADDNLTFGSRDLSTPTALLVKGCDLDVLFPANRPRDNAGLTLSYSDVFGEKDPTTGIVRPPAKLGAYHQYRIRTVDAAGRISGTETLSGVVRLEKHTPPPLPTGPQPPPGLDAKGNLLGPPGPRARAIVKGAAGLTPTDIAILGAHQNAIVLEWGWSQAERDLDPTTAEFRVYLTSPADTISASITSVTSATPNWNIAMSTTLPLVTNELAGQWLTSGGYPFLIVSNTAGTIPSVQVEQSVLKPTAQPINGPINFGRPLRPEHQRPTGWSQRAAFYSLTAADTYHHVFYDVLTLSPTHPRDSIWVGVSATDAESYVPDERTSGNLANRPGNESGIVTCAVTARYQGQPVFSVPPPLGEVPEQVTEEPTGRQVLTTLDLPTLLAGALPLGAPAVLERYGTDEILNRLSVADNTVLIKLPDGTISPVPFPNPTDLNTVLATLNGPTPEQLPNRFLLHAVATTPDPSVFFTRSTADIISVGPVTDSLPQKPGRFFYFVRAADALGHLSAGGALLPIVVRVPSVADAATPIRRALTATSSSVSLTVAVPPDPDTTTLLLFAALTPPNTMPPTQSEAEIQRVPNRRDLYPNNGLRLRLSDGTLLAPAAVKALSDMDVTVEADGTRVATIPLSVPGGGWATLWCYGVTLDGQPSRRCGPFGQGVPA